LVVPEPKKRPKTSYIRFQAAMPNETWQSDFTHYRLTRPGDPEPRTGPDCEVITWLDDHARYALHISAHVRVSGPIVLATFRETAGQHGYPASTLTDNGLVYTARFAGGPGGRTSLEHELQRLDIVQKNSRPNHPTTCGKVERFQQTMKKWLRAQPVQPTTLAELQALLAAFADEYNHRRPHRSLPQRGTPATAYRARPKATPSANRSNDSHQRVRTDRLDQSDCVTLRVNGRLHHIGVGRTHARTHILLLVQDLDVRIVDAATGELLRELTINPDKDFQGTGRPPGPPPGPRQK
jgi:transposase InsO family protein